jgi:hypothetical protein
MFNRRAFTSLVASTGVLAASLFVATPAFARDGDVRKSVRCSNGSIAKLKLAPRDGAIETEFEVDSNRVGQRWSVRITDNGSAVLTGTRRTVAPSGSFSVHRRIANRAGTDRIVARASFAGTGETCRVAAST